MLGPAPIRARHHPRPKGETHAGAARHRAAVDQSGHFVEKTYETVEMQNSGYVPIPGRSRPGCVVSPVHSPVPASSWVGEVDPLVVALALGQARTASRSPAWTVGPRRRSRSRARLGVLLGGRSASRPSRAPSGPRKSRSSRASWRAWGVTRARPRTRRSRPGGRGRRVRGGRFAAAACGAACRRRD